MPQVGTLIVNNTPGSQDCTNVWFLKLWTFQKRFKLINLSILSLQIIFDLLCTFDIQLFYLVTSHYNSFMTSTKLLDCTNLWLKKCVDMNGFASI